MTTCAHGQGFRVTSDGLWRCPDCQLTMTLDTYIAMVVRAVQIMLGESS